MFLGLDIGTSGSKAALVTDRGTVVATAARPHSVTSPRPGWFEHDADRVWWEAACALIQTLLTRAPATRIDAVGVSGIGPVSLVTDDAGRPLRPAILYGIDTRAEEEIVRLEADLGAETVQSVCGNRLTSQAVGPKLAWIRRHEPDVWAQARRWYLSSGYVVFRLTGEYVADHYTASASDPLYALRTGSWWSEAWAAVAPTIAPPRLAWPAEIVGRVTSVAAAATGLPVGTPVVTGTTDALAEAYSVGCSGAGDTMVMYGSTLFLIEIVAAPVTHRSLWAAVGRTPGTYSLAAGMATSGLVTTWFGELTGREIPDLVDGAAQVAPGSAGLVLLPYFAGERTPLFDPRARGCWVGLTLRHTRAHLYRSILEGVAYGVRHNLETMVEAGAPPRRLVAVGGGTRRDLWVRIVSDVTQRPQALPAVTIGAAYGDARMAADASGVDTAGWNADAHLVEPAGAAADVYDRLYRVYRRTYTNLREDLHALADVQT